LGYLTYGHGEEQVFLGRDIARDKNYSEEIAACIDRETKRIMAEALEKATKIIIEHREKLNSIANTLLEKETIEGPEFLALMGNKPGVEVQQA
jgi:cell division protease FtsH